MERLKNVFKIDDKINKQLIITSASIILTVVLVLTTTMAAFTWNDSSEDQKIESTHIGVSITNTKGTLTLEDAYPKGTQEAIEDDRAYTFTVTNTSDVDVYYGIELVSDSDAVTVDGCIDNQIPLDNINWYIGEDNSNMVNTIEYNNEIVSEAYLKAGESKTYNLKLWITNDAPNSVIGAHFHGKLNLDYRQATNYTKLSDKIKENNEPSTQKPNFDDRGDSDEGLIEDEDADGKTYYFRGAVKDNYLKIEGLKWPADASTSYVLPNETHVYENKSELEADCNKAFDIYGYSTEQECIDAKKEVGAKPGEDMIFRIVRINGDGTTRIIADGSIGIKSLFNQVNNQEQYVGYTYENSKPNVQDGKKSTIREYLDNWYKTNMTDYDKIFASTRYCNDTSTGHTDDDGNLYYGAYDRINTSSPTPTYICPSTDKNYGGEYYLKIGLLTADEVSFAGGPIESDSQNFYLYGNNGDKWLGTPYSFEDNSAYGFELSGSSYFSALDYKYAESAIPVLNLKAQTPYVSGDGTKDNPYIVKVGE